MLHARGLHARGLHAAQANRRLVVTRASSSSMQPAPPADVAPLFQPTSLGGLELQNRMVYAPLTRCRATPQGVPVPMMATYYAQRAYPGSLMISEATQVDRDANGYPGAPGIYSKEQVEAWKPITQAVKDKGTVFFMQLWHAGRASHSAFGMGPPVSSSEVAIASEAWRNVYLGNGQMGLYEVPKALDEAGIKQKIEAFRQSARNAIDAGFQGVELHAANGYLIDQFTKSSVNKRTDGYGGSIERRCRFALEVVEAVAKEVGPERVGIRLSPDTSFLDAIDDTPYATFTYLVEQLNKFNLGYLHMVEARIEGNDDKDSRFSLVPFRKIFNGTFIAAGGYTRESGSKAVASDHADLICYGRLWLANPDLPKRFLKNAPLNRYDRNTFYSPGEKGYTDYPFME